MCALSSAGGSASCATEPAAAQAAALYVSTRGDDSRDGASPERSLRTISKAIERARPGTTVFIEQGAYYERVATRRGGRPNREITLTSYRGTATIDGSRDEDGQAADQNTGLVELRHPHVRLSGLRIVNSKRSGVVLAADDLTVEGCEISRTSLHAISTHTGRQEKASRRGGRMIRNVVLRDNTVHDAVLAGRGRGQAISIIADGFLVAGNTVRDNLTEGIDVWLGARRGEVVGNTVHGNGAAGIYVDGASHVRIHRNRVYANRSGIGVSSEDPRYSTRDIWVYNNLAYDNEDAGCFVWDEPAGPGPNGSQNVLIAHNTLVGNRRAVYISGRENSVEVANNLGLSTGESVLDNSADSSVKIHNNVWLKDGGGFASRRDKDFRLSSSSPAIDKGAPLSLLGSGGGEVFTIITDYAGSPRVAGPRPDAGAYEYH